MTSQEKKSQGGVMPDSKFIKALARHELARQKVDALSREIGNAVGLCPTYKEALKDPYGDLWTQDQKHAKTHLWHAFQHKEPSSCGWGEVHLCEDGILDALSEGSEFECEHCLQAYRFIVERKHARQELGYARLSIRALGRQAIKMVADDE